MDNLPIQPQPPGPPSHDEQHLPEHQPHSTAATIIALVVLLLAAVGVAAFFYGQNYRARQLNINPAPTQQACSLEAKVCPDGTSVGRTGPNCEFAPCPTASKEYLTIAPWGVRLPLSAKLKSLKLGKIKTSVYSQTDQDVIIIAPQLDSNWNCVEEEEGIKGFIGVISRTSAAKRSGPGSPLITKKVGDYTYGFEELDGSSCTNDPTTYQELVNEFAKVFPSLESY